MRAWEVVCHWGLFALTQPEMLSALRKLFADEVFPCIVSFVICAKIENKQSNTHLHLLFFNSQACTLCFVREEYLQQHLDQKHGVSDKHVHVSPPQSLLNLRVFSSFEIDHPELLDHDVLLARAKFFYQLRRAIVDAEKNPIVSCLDSEMKLPPLQSSSVAPLLAMIEAVPPMGEWTTEELAAMAAEDDARRQTECDRQLLQQRLEETAEAAADGGTAVATTTPTDVVAPTAGSSAVQDTAKRISESDTAANCSAAEPTLPRRSPPPGRPVGGPIGMYADDVPYERPTATDAAAAATNSDGTAPANRVVRPGRTTSWATDGAAGQDDGVDAAITAAGPGAQGSSSSQHHGRRLSGVVVVEEFFWFDIYLARLCVFPIATRTPSLLARRSFLSAPGATSSLTRTVSAVLSEGAAPSQEQQESEYSRARIR